MPRQEIAAAYIGYLRNGKFGCRMQLVIFQKLTWRVGIEIIVFFSFSKINFILPYFIQDFNKIDYRLIYFTLSSKLWPHCLISLK